jgi:hypothetical protein
VTDRFLSVVLLFLLVASALASGFTHWLFKPKQPSLLMWMLVDLPLCVVLTLIFVLTWLLVKRTKK